MCNSISLVSSTQLICSISAHSAGSFPVFLYLNNQGNSNKNITYMFDLSVTSFSKSQGSIGGSLMLTITGEGFSNGTNITICNNTCTVKTSSINSITCSVS